LMRLEKLDVRWTKLRKEPPWFVALRERGCRILV